jgi:DNA-binding XRE family transcriptional regulator
VRCPYDVQRILRGLRWRSSADYAKQNKGKQYKFRTYRKSMNIANHKNNKISFCAKFNVQKYTITLSKMNITPDILKNARANLGYTQSKVAELIGVTTKAYSNYEAGKMNPKFKVARELVKVLKLDIEKLDTTSSINTINSTESTIADRAIIQVIYNNLAKVMAETYKITLEEALKRLEDDTVLMQSILLKGQ